MDGKGSCWCGRTKVFVLVGAKRPSYMFFLDEPAELRLIVQCAAFFCYALFKVFFIEWIKLEAQVGSKMTPQVVLLQNHYNETL